MKRILFAVSGAVIAGVVVHFVLESLSQNSAAKDAPRGDDSDDGLLEKEGSLGV